MHKSLETDSIDSYSDLSKADENPKLSFVKFLSQMDSTGELLNDKSLVDHVKKKRCIRVDLMSKKMDEARYLDFSKARSVSFANKNKHKFSDWIGSSGKFLHFLYFFHLLSTESNYYYHTYTYFFTIFLSGDFTVSKSGYSVLGYLAYETVAQIVDLAFLVRQDQNKIQGDSIDRLQFSFPNPITYRPHLYNKVNK